MPTWLGELQHWVYQHIPVIVAWLFIHHKYIIASSTHEIGYYLLLYILNHFQFANIYSMPQRPKKKSTYKVTEDDLHNNPAKFNPYKVCLP